VVVDGYPLPDQQIDNVLNSFGTGGIGNMRTLHALILKGYFGGNYIMLNGGCANITGFG
jgi:hypothetical protein